MKYFRRIPVLVISCALSFANADWLKNVTRSYDKKLRPSPKGSADNVTVQIGIVSLGPINAKDFTFEIDMYLRHWWNDPRLKFDGNLSYTYNGDPADMIWIPDTYFENSKKTISHQVMTPNKRAIIRPDGNVFVSMRATATCSCPMDLRLYPFDTQECQLILGSYSFTGNELAMSWNDKPITVDTVSGYVQLSSYVFKDVKTEQIQIDMGSNSEHFIILKCKFKVQRSFASSISRIYIPSSFLVVLTWATFYLPASAIPARITLIVTNFLATIFITQNTASQIADVDYTTAVGVYLLGNVVFITLTLLELLIVLNTQNRSKVTEYSKDEKESKENADDAAEKVKLTIENDAANLTKKETAAKEIHFVDHFAKIAFPVSYLLFIVVYFSYYLTSADK